MTGLFLSCSGSDNPNKEVTIEKDTTFFNTYLDYETINFPSKDSATITANEYKIDDSSPSIVICHQAQFNTFEHEGIAQRLNENGLTVSLLIKDKKVLLRQSRMARISQQKKLEKSWIFEYYSRHQHSC
jgi:hypothetical protein